MKWFFNNLVDKSLVTASAIDSNFPTDNIKDSRKEIVSRLTTSDGWFLFDTKSASSVDYILIRAASSGFGFSGSLTIEANYTSDFSAPAYTTSLTPDLRYGVAWASFTDRKYRFWRITGTSSNVFELSNVFIGKSFGPVPSINFGWKDLENDRSTSRGNRYNEKFFDVLNSQRLISGKYQNLTPGEKETIQDNFRVAGKTEPLWLMLDPESCFSSDPELLTDMFYIKSSPSWVNSSPSLFTGSSFTIEEAV